MFDLSKRFKIQNVADKLFISVFNCKTSDIKLKKKQLAELVCPAFSARKKLTGGMSFGLFFFKKKINPIKQVSSLARSRMELVTANEQKKCSGRPHFCFILFYLFGYQWPFFSLQKKYKLKPKKNFPWLCTKNISCMQTNIDTPCNERTEQNTHFAEDVVGRRIEA